MQIEFELKFEKNSALKYGIVIARQLQISLVITSAALWPSSLPCLSVIFFEISRIPLDGISCNFILVNNLIICRQNSNFIKLGHRIMSAVLGDRYIDFGQFSIKNS